MAAKGRNTRRSRFAASLAALLDDTKFFTRLEWAKFLGVSAPAISQWVNDKTVPRPAVLRMLLDVLRNSRQIPAGPLAEFDEISVLRTSEISPLGERMLPNVREYMRGATASQFARQLRNLTTAQRHLALADGSWNAVSRGPATIDAAKPAGLLNTELGDPIEPALLPCLQRVSGDALERIHWDSLQSCARVIISGAPGTGKSYLLAALFEAFREAGRFPVRITARIHWGKMAEKPRLASLVHTESATESTPIVLVDGFDEIVGERRVTAAKEIVAFLDQSPGARIFISSRPAPELTFFEGFDHVSVAPLTNPQILLGLERRFRSHRVSTVGLAQDLERYVCQLAERRGLHSSLRSPLFLDIASTLFVRHSVTPFKETEIVAEIFQLLLDQWDRAKDVIRTREPWASPHNLLTILGELCFRLIEAERREFDTDDLSRWVGSKFGDVPVDLLLSLLSNQYGLIGKGTSAKWRFVRPYFLYYLAATHIVESTGNASQYLKDWPHRKDVRNVFRLACGMTSDATPLLKKVLKTDTAAEADRGLLLAEAMAQPVVASHDVLTESCDTTVHWLDRALAKWHLVFQRSSDDAAELQPIWELRVRGESRRTPDERILRALHAIHQARFGPARQLMIDRLRKANSSVLPAFAQSMAIEGRLRTELNSSRAAQTLRITIVTP